MKEPAYIQLQLAEQNAIVHISPLHIVAICPRREDNHTDVLTTCGVRYVVKEPALTIANMVTELLY